MLKIKKLLILATVVFIIGLIGSFITYKSLPKAETRTEELADTNLTNIEVSVSNGEIEIISTNEQVARMEVTGYKLASNFQSNLSNNTLSIQYNDKSKKFFNFGFNQQTVEVHLYIPKKDYELIEANAENGKINLASLQAGELILLANNGSLNIESSHVDRISVKSNNGKIDAANINGNQIKLQADNGRIQFTNSNVDTAEIVTENGKVELSDLVGAITAKASNGQISFTTNELASPLDFATNNGKIQIEVSEEPENAEIHAQIDNGTVHLFGKKTSHALYGSGENKINLQANNGKIIVRNK